MTDKERAEKYDELLYKAEKVNRELSSLKSGNSGVVTNSPEFESKLKVLNRNLAYYENEMRKLFGKI